MANTLQTLEFVDIPASVQDACEQVKIKEARVKVTVGADMYDVYYQEPDCIISCQTSLLLLHGMKFKSQTWRDLGTLHLAGAMGMRTVAVDLPGYGETSGKVKDTAAFLSQFISEVGLDRPVLVSPSMSGSFALPFLLSDPDNAENKSRGYIPVAPVMTDRFARDMYTSCKVPTLIVYGSEDNITGEVSLSNLQQMPNCRPYCFQGAGHPCYLDQPELWHKLLYNFIQFLEKK